MATVRYFHLPAGKFFLAKNANATVVKRPPLSELILSAQDRQSVFKLKMDLHIELIALTRWRAGNPSQSVGEPVAT